MLNRLGELPSIENLQCFLAAAEHLNFRRAAAQVYLTPTAFGQRIRQLEETLGETLFHRTTRKVELSPAGMRLLEVAGAVVLEARRCIERVHGDDAPARFVLGTRFELGLSWLTPSVLTLREERPHWTVHMYFGSGTDILARLEGGQVDCVVTSAPVARHAWETAFLHEETYALVATPELLERAPFERVEDAQHHTLIDINANLPLTRYLSGTLGTLDFGHMVLVGTGGAVVQFVLSGAGVAVAPEYMIREELASGKLVRLLPDVDLLTDSFRLLWRRNAPLESTFRDLATWLRARPLM